LLFVKLPVQPGGLVVLTVGVVVAVLGVAQLVAAADHRHALGEEQGGDQIPLLAFAEGAASRIVARPLGAAVPAQVIVAAVFVVLAIGFVVFLVVTDQVLQREAIVAGNEVDAGVGQTAALLVQVA